MKHRISLRAKGYYGFIRLHKNFQDNMDIEGDGKKTSLEGTHATQSYGITAK
jgi:hypothetical protein